MEKKLCLQKEVSVKSDDDEWWLSRNQIQQARARNIFENIILETKTLPFSQWLPVYAFAQRHL